MVSFYNEELLAPHPTPKLEDLHLLIVRDCLFNIFVATVHIWRLPSLQPETRHSVLTGTHYHRQFLFTDIWKSGMSLTKDAYPKCKFLYTRTHTNESPVVLLWRKRSGTFRLRIFICVTAHHFPQQGISNGLA